MTFKSNFSLFITFENSFCKTLTGNASPVTSVFLYYYSLFNFYFPAFILPCSSLPLPSLLNPLIISPLFFSFWFSSVFGNFFLLVLYFLTFFVFSSFHFFLFFLGNLCHLVLSFPSFLFPFMSFSIFLPSPLLPFLSPPFSLPLSLPFLSFPSLKLIVLPTFHTKPLYRFVIFHTIFHICWFVCVPAHVASPLIYSCFV